MGDICDVQLVGKGEKGKIGSGAKVVRQEDSGPNVPDGPIFNEVMVEFIVGHNGRRDSVLRVLVMKEEIGVRPVFFFVDGNYALEGVSHIACVGVEQTEVHWLD